MYASILNVTFDCADSRAQAVFWAAVTGWTAEERDATPGHVEYARADGDLLASGVPARAFPFSNCDPLRTRAVKQTRPCTPCLQIAG